MAIKHPISGWKATTDVQLGQFVLRLTTVKQSRGLCSRATCHKVDGNFETHRMFHDYSHEWIRSNPARVTEAAVDRQHEAFDTMLEAVKKHATEWYASKGEPVESVPPALCSHAQGGISPQL